VPERVLPFAAFALVLLATSSTVAQPLYAGATTRTPALSSASAAVQASAASAFERLSISNVSKGPTPQVQPDRVEDLQRILSDARVRYLDGEFKEALDATDLGIGRFEEKLAFRATPDAWVAFGELMLVRALALRRLGREAESDDALTALAAAFPSYVPDPGLAPPKVAARYQAGLKKLRERQPVTLEIQSRPAGANVVLDGRALGVTPLVVKDLLPGKHYVALDYDGDRMERAAVFARPTEKISSELGDPRAKAARALLRALGTPIEEAALVKLARTVGDDVTSIVLVPEEGSVLVLAGRVRDGKLASVVGAAIPASLVGLDAALGALAVASREAKADGFTAGTTGDASTLRRRFLAGGAVAAPTSDDGATWLNIGGASAEILVVAAAATIGTLAVLASQSDPNVVVVIDASRL